MRNHRRTVFAVLVSAFVIGALVVPAGAHYRKANGKRVSKKHARMHRQQVQQDSAQQTTDFAPAGLVATAGDLKIYSATVDGPTLQELANGGYDVTPTGDSLEGIDVALVLSAGERKALEAKGISLQFLSSGQERKTGRVAAADSMFGWDVYRSYDEPGGIRDEIYQLARRNPQILKLVKLGTTHQGREYLALKMTQGARGQADGSRPAVLYVSTYHAREWISTEVNRRLLHWYIDQWRANNKEIRDLLKTTELWFVLVHNPDGYEYTFTTDRLWRKNLRDNDGDGKITGVDGVDPNRNHTEHWNYDNEGSNSAFASETYRGPSAGSEPETQAMMSLYDRVDFRFSISYHSFGELLLYTQGWQTLTPSADDPIYVALSGTDDDPAIAGYNPGVGADLYTTNGEYTDWAHGTEGTLSWTPELSEGCEGCQFEFPDDEALVQEEFERNLEFAVNVAKSAGDPDDPVSHAGIDTDEMYLDVAEIDPWKTNWPSSDLRVDVSYAGGESQPVEVLAKRSIGAVTLNYKVNGGATQTAPTSEAPSGEVFNGNGSYDDYYYYLRGTIAGPLSEGASIEYWFTGGGESTDHVTFDVEGDGTADVLIVAAEDRTGQSNSPAYAPPTYSNTAAVPNFVDEYTAAVTAAGRTSEVYDVDAMDREAPDHTGVLNHYDSVVWYTGNDATTREPVGTGHGPGDVSRLAVDLVLEHRAYLNEVGNLMYSGQRAGFTENGFNGGQFYDPVANEPCFIGGEENPAVIDRCLMWSDKNDFLQYYLGAFIYNSLGNPGTTTEVEGTDAPYAGASWFLNGADSANNQNHHASFITTSSILPKDEYPQFTSDARANYVADGPNPFEPFDGQWYMYSQQADVSFKRLGRSFTVPPAGGEMTFQISYDTEHDWDFVFVEVHTVVDRGADNPEWTTLEDENGHNSQSTGPNDPNAASCPAGWHDLHPHLAHYQTWDGVGACTPTGTTGEWWANSGRSDGWEDWAVDLTPYAGDDIEIFISYASDWAIQGLGSFVDFIQMPGEATVESFETGMGAWSASQPPDSDPNPNNWIRTESVGFEEGAIVSLTPTEADFTTLFAGFGIEAVRTAAARGDVMDRSLDFFGTP
jgi:Zinc carboxypeptidase